MLFGVRCQVSVFRDDVSFLKPDTRNLKPHLCLLFNLYHTADLDIIAFNDDRLGFVGIDMGDLDFSGFFPGKEKAFFVDSFHHFGAVKDLQQHTVSKPCFPAGRDDDAVFIF